MDHDELLAFLRRAPYWVLSTRARDGSPQGAVIGVAVADGFELVFDTLQTSRKCANLRADPRVALAMWDGERTAQVEGLADEPDGDELARAKSVYFERFPDGPLRERWPDITYVRVRPTWLRDSDFAGAVPVVREHTGEELRRA